MSGHGAKRRARKRIIRILAILRMRHTRQQLWLWTSGPRCAGLRRLRSAGMTAAKVVDRPASLTPPWRRISSPPPTTWFPRGRCRRRIPRASTAAARCRRLAMRSMVSGAASASRSAALSLSTIGRGRAGGRHDAVFAARPRSPGSAASATVGRSGKAAERLRAGDRERAHLAVAHDADRRRQRRHVHRDMAAEEIGQRRAGAAIGHVGELHVGHHARTGSSRDGCRCRRRPRRS